LGIGQSTGEPRVEPEPPIWVESQQGDFAPSALFPVSLMLPLKVAAEIRSARAYQIIDKNQDIPVAILTWMRNDSRYASLFK